MITLTPLELGLFIIILSVLSAGLAYMIGFHIGQSHEAGQVYDYWRKNQMSLTEELIKDRYTLVSRTDIEAVPKAEKPW